MQDELLIEIDTGWHVFNDMALEIMTGFGRSRVLSAKFRQTPHPNATIHKEEE